MTMNCDDSYWVLDADLKVVHQVNSKNALQECTEWAEQQIKLWDYSQPPQSFTVVQVVATVTMEVTPNVQWRW